MICHSDDAWREEIQQHLSHISVMADHMMAKKNKGSIREAVDMIELLQTLRQITNDGKTRKAPLHQDQIQRQADGTGV